MKNFKRAIVFLILFCLASSWTFLGRIGTLFVERFDHAGGLASLDPIKQAASAGDSLFFYPEGTFTHAPGLRPFHLGAFVAAANNRLPVVPVAIQGTRGILTGDNWKSRPGSVHITVGAPIDTLALSNEVDSDLDLALQLRAMAREHILAHCGEADLGHEPVFPPRKD
jgi:1-acyl-sn-glycerol-3-phosphate acyltransferase